MTDIKKLIEAAIAVGNPLPYIAIKVLTRKGREDLKDNLDNLVEIGQKTYNHVSDSVDTISGKKEVDKAVERGNRLERKADDIRFRYESQTSSLNVSINSYVNSINASKKRIKEDLFRNLANKLSTLTRYRIEDYPIEQHFYDIKNVSFESSSSAYIESFTVPDIMISAVNTFSTIGFVIKSIYNRYKANQINEELDKQELIIDEAEAKCDAEIQRLRLIEASIAFIAIEFRNLENIFERVVILIDEPIQYMKDNNIHKFDLLPEELKKKFLAVIQIKDILKGVVERQIFKCNEEVEVQRFKNEINTISNNARQNLIDVNVLDFQYNHANDFPRKTSQCNNSRHCNSTNDKFVIREVKNITCSHLSVVAEIISGSFEVGDKIILKFGKNEELGPYEIGQISQYGYGTVLLDIKKTIGEMSKRIHKDWTGHRL